MKLRTGLAAAALAAASILATSSASLSADSQKTWQGLVQITALTSQCSTAGFSVGSFGVSVYRPKILATDTTWLSLVFNRTAISAFNSSEATRKQMHGAGNYKGFAINGRAKAFSYNSTYNLKIAPLTIAATTKTVTVSGTLNNFYSIAGCTATILASYEPRAN